MTRAGRRGAGDRACERTSLRSVGDAGSSNTLTPSPERVLHWKCSMMRTRPSGSWRRSQHERPPWTSPPASVCAYRMQSRSPSRRPIRAPRRTRPPAYVAHTRSPRCRNHIREVVSTTPFAAVDETCITRPSRAIILLRSSQHHAQPSHGLRHANRRVTGPRFGGMDDGRRRYRLTLPSPRAQRSRTAR